MPNVFRIYQLSEQLEHLLDALEQNPEADPTSLQAGIDALTGEFNTRVEDVALASRNAAARADALHREIQRLSALAAKELAMEAKLKAALLSIMENAHLQKVKGSLVTVSVAKNGGAQPIELTVDPKDLPPEFRKEKVEYALNREEVDKRLSVGLDLPDCIKLKERGSHIRIS